MRTTRYRSVIVLLMLAVPLSAQLVNGFGAYGAINIANAKSDDAFYEDAVSYNAAAAGAFVSLKLTDMLSIQPEVTYTTKGWRLESNDSGVETNTIFAMNYIEMPVLLVASFGDKFSILAGPYISLFQDGEAESTITFDGDSEMFTLEMEADGITSPELGITLGATFNLGKLFLSARASTSLESISQPTDDVPEEDLADIRHDVLQLLVGLRF